MNCEWAEQQIAFYIYDELPDDLRYELEQHLAHCGKCARELKGARRMSEEFSAVPVQEPSPALLASSRMRLQEALEGAQQGGFWRKLTFDPADWLRQMRFSPALAAMILIVGFAGGIGASYNILSSKIPQSPTPNNSNNSMEPTQASIGGIRSITKEPGTNRINIQYDSVSPQEAQGSLNDQRIQQLLLFAARNNYNSGLRLDSVGLLAQQPTDAQTKEILIYALRYDPNPGVRLKALEGLSASVKDDLQVRNALLEAVLNDSNPGLRIEALHLLYPVRADSSVQSVLQRLSKNDRNQYIRSEARTELAQLREMD